MSLCSTASWVEPLSFSSEGESWDEKRERMKFTGDPRMEDIVDGGLDDGGVGCRFTAFRFMFLLAGETFCLCLGGGCCLRMLPNISFHVLLNDGAKHFLYVFS